MIYFYFVCFRFIVSVLLFKIVCYGLRVCCNASIEKTKK